MPQRDLVEVASRFLYGGVPISRTVWAGDQPHQVGRQDRFWIDDLSCGGLQEITATLRVISPHLYMYVQDGTTVNQEDLERATQIFEEKIYPTCHQIFGSEWTPGVDGDPHITVLNARFDGASGYFSSLNEVPRQVHAYSNQREMFYINLDYFIVGSPPYLSTMAHELQHLIHWNLDCCSETWVDEGMAQMAEYAIGYDSSSMAWVFLDNPDLQLTAWAENPDDSLPHYAASYLWFRYFVGRAGGFDVLASLLDPALDSISAIERALGKAGYRPAVSAPRLFDAFFADWAVANYLNDPHVADGRYAYDPPLKLPPLWPQAVYFLPWETSTTVHPYAADYIEVRTTERGTLHISFDGAETLPLLDTTPHSGDHFWWSNRGDQLDTSLTRPLDLSAVGRATLSYWLWYDIEDDFDYVYAVVSTDKGRTWTMLTTPHTTAENPNGTNLGHGYTGTSGRGATPQWIQEEIDLSPFAGREILLRFEMITDDAYNGPGLGLDDVAVPEIGFFDDMETDKGWESRGFVWVDNLVPVYFQAQVVTEGRPGEADVQPISLDAEQRGEARLAYPGSGTKVTIVISAVAPATTEPAGYTLRLELE